MHDKMKKDLLKNKNCLITGASGGLGREISKLLVNQSCNLFLTGRNKIKLSNLQKELELINSNNVKLSHYAGDISKTADLSEIIKNVRNKFVNIDILINCAGIFLIKSLEESTYEDLENCFSVNVRAPFLLSKEFSNDMIKNKWGRIVNIGSSSSYQGFLNGSIYVASKFAILGLSRTLHDELKEYNVRTYCVSPGSIKTEMSKLSKDQDYNTFLDPKEVAEFVIFQIMFDNEMVVEESRLSRMLIR